jgi:hypothetical protein
LQSPVWIYEHAFGKEDPFYEMSLPPLAVAILWKTAWRRILTHILHFALLRVPTASGGNDTL